MKPADRVMAGLRGSMAGQEDTAFEERCVQFLFKAFGCPEQGAILRSIAQSRTGSPALTFALLNEQHPNFPFIFWTSRLEGTKLALETAALLPNLFLHFERASFVRIYRKRYQEIRAMRRAQKRSLVGMIFPRQGIRNGLVLHNGHGLDFRRVDGMLLQYHSETGEKPRDLVLQPFSQLLKILQLDGGWTP